MRYVLCALLITALFFSLGCPTRPTGLENVTLFMFITGPFTISEASGPVSYNVVIAASGKPSNVTFNPTTPLYLQESDGTLMTFTQSVNIPAGANSQTLQLKLSCTGGKVGGDAYTVPGPQQNNPLSSAGTSRPALVAVYFQGQRYDSSSANALGTMIPITCRP